MGKLWFEIRASGLRFKRGLANLRSAHKPNAEKTQTTSWQSVLAESISPLWSALADDDQRLVAGKVQNLRVAAAHLNGQLVSAGGTFSFWQTVGKPTQARGFVDGRELREGCMIASVGGGLCQLSNALYAAALQGGLRIIERHAHSQVVPGSMAATGSDATVFWNYVDLRFSSTSAFVIDAHLTPNSLVVRLRSAGSAGSLPVPAAKPHMVLPIIPLQALQRLQVGEVDDCASCDQHGCVENITPAEAPAPLHESTTALLDARWPEFDDWLGRTLAPGDSALVPLDGVRRKRPNYAWQVLARPQIRVIEQRWFTARRSVESRLLSAQGAARQRKLLAQDAALAQRYARQIPLHTRHVVVPLHLLAHLYQLGCLGGRRVTVLMTRAPLVMLQQALDRASALHPESPTLADFRAEARLQALEQRALQAAQHFVTPHSMVAAYLKEHYSTPVMQLAWANPTVTPLDNAASNVLFPASALGRKGAFELKAAWAMLEATQKTHQENQKNQKWSDHQSTQSQLIVLGSAQDTPQFWRGLASAPKAAASDVWQGVGCVVLPAFVEHQPRMLLRALAANIAVICTPECGLAASTPGVTLVPAGDSQALAAALQAFVQR